MTKKLKTEVSIIQIKTAIALIRMELETIQNNLKLLEGGDNNEK